VVSSSISMGALWRGFNRLDEVGPKGILADAPGAILPHMRRSFIHKQYSPSTGMDQSEWEIILEELMGMRLIVKNEPICDGDV
jgi:hypothetical protein